MKTKSAKSMKCAVKEFPPMFLWKDIEIEQEMHDAPKDNAIPNGPFYSDF